MKEIVVNKLMLNIKNKNNNLDEIKLEEIRYGLLGLYSLITKTIVIFLISLYLNFFKEFIIFFIFYTILRACGYGVHAKSNFRCWIISPLLLIGTPYLFNKISLNFNLLSFIWIICFINYLIFCPADTEKKPMINKVRKLKFKTSILFISIIYLIILYYNKNISNLIIASMVLEALLTNPIGYILMGQKVRFKLSDIYLFKQKRIKKEV